MDSILEGNWFDINLQPDVICFCKCFFLFCSPLYKLILIYLSALFWKDSNQSTKPLHAVEFLINIYTVLLSQPIGSCLSKKGENIIETRVLTWRHDLAHSNVVLIDNTVSFYCRRTRIF